MSARTKLIAAATLYATVGVFTFGYSAASAWNAARAEYLSCQTRDEICFDDSNLAVFKGFTAAIVWPLYWSWELQA